jgi:uncharacterized ferritin-like protein (DUF455 family)
MPPVPQASGTAAAGAVRVQELARTIVCSPELEDKLASPPGAAEGSGLDWSLTAAERQRAELPRGPARLPAMQIVGPRKAKVPSLEGWQDPWQRRRILHALANHELQAAELFAWALLAFPEAPEPFRHGLLKVLLDEQRHTRMYLGRLRASGGEFGDHPVSGHFWRKVGGILSPAHFVCVMSLTFENANLDHTVESSEAALAAGDPKSAAVIDQVRADEIEHVRFGWRWLGEFKRPEQSMWEAYRESLAVPMHAGRATGRQFDPAPRRQVGMDEAFIRELERAHAHTGSGGHRLDRPGGEPVR